MNIHISNQIHQGNAKEIQDGILKAYPDPHGNRLQEDSSTNVDQRLYKSMIGSLIYETVALLDVMQAVGQVA